MSERSAARQRRQRIYEVIRDRICSNHYPPEAILREQDLSGEFEVSRTPIRQVLSMLEHDGLVDVRHGIGNIVTTVDPLGLVEVYTVRMILAQAAGDYYRSPFPPDTQHLLGRSRDDFAGLEHGDVIGFGEANIRYYLRLTDIVGNTCLRDLQRKLFFQTARMWLISLPSMNWSETIAAVVSEIDELLRVIALEDPIGLGLVTRNHIFMSRRRVFIGLGLSTGEARNPL